MASLETMKGVGIGKRIGNSFGNFHIVMFLVLLLNLGPDRGVFNQRGFWEVPPENERVAPLK